MLSTTRDLNRAFRNVENDSTQSDDRLAVAGTVRRRLLLEQ
jgi:hypothetical protein